MNNNTATEKVPLVTGPTSGIDESTATEFAFKRTYMKTKRTIKLLAVITTAAVSPITWAGPHVGGGAVVSGAHPGGSQVGGIRTAPPFTGGQLRAPPALRGAYFTGRSVGGVNRTPNFYYGGAGMPAGSPHTATAPVNPPTRINGRTPSISNEQERAALLMRQNTQAPKPQVAATDRRPGNMGSIASRNRVPNPRTSTAVNRQSFVKNHASERHDAKNWHRDWDRHHAHFHNKRVFVFVNGFWWGLYPWDYYPYYASDYPYDYGSSYPYDYYNGYPYSYYDPSYSSDFDDQASYSEPSQSVANATVTTVQSELARLGYYHGAIDGVIGDETQAALARFQEDHDLSVTGTLTTATLQSLGSPESYR